MPRADLIVHNAGQLVTCASGGTAKRGAAMLDVGIIPNGAVAIADGKFVGVGTSSDILSEFESAETIDVDGQVVCPGFVDPHTHIVYAGDRIDEFEIKIKGAAYLEILAGGGGILLTVQETIASDTDGLVADGNRRLDKMLACGTTTVEIKTGYGLNTETELKMLRVISEMDQMHVVDVVPTILAAHAVPPEFAGRADEYVDQVCSETLPAAMEFYRKTHFPLDGTPIFADVFCEAKAFDLAQSQRVLETAKKMGFALKAHVDQFTNLGGSRLAIGLGAASTDHLDTISEGEIDLLAASNTVGVVIPTENFNAGKTKFADGRKLIDRGCVVAISTDYNPGSAPCPSMPMAMAISCRYQRLLPSEVLNAATINAAHAIGLGGRTGSIEAGKIADLLFLDGRDYREIAYEFGGNLVRSVIKRGRVVI